MVNANQWLQIKMYVYCRGLLILTAYNIKIMSRDFYDVILNYDF